MTASLDAPLNPGSPAASDCAVGPETREIGRIGEYAQMLDCAEVEAVLRGDGEAYSRLLRRYESEIARQMWRFTRDPHERDELVQEVFVEAYMSLRGYRQKAPFLHWLRTIAVRRGYRFWKQREKQKKLVPLEDWDGAARVQDPPPQEAGRQLQDLLLRLKPQERVVMTLEYLDGHSVEETAKLLGWTQAMVKMRAYRAKKKLRALYERGGNPEEGRS